MKNSALLPAVTLFGLAALVLTGCTADPGNATGATAAAISDAIPTQEVDTDLADMLPDEVKEAGSLTAVDSGSFPPYIIIDGDTSTGAAIDLGDAIGQILDVDIEHQTVDGLASVLSGMQAGRYDLDLGPVGDFVERQQQATFIDWVQEYVVFAVKAGNPQEISDLDSTCGLKIAVQAAGSAEKVITAQSDTCVAAGEPAIEVQSYKDQPSSILAVQSDRADAFFSSQAPLTYFVDQSNGDLELAGVGEANGFSDLYQGAVVPIDSGLAEPILGAIELLHENGTYDAIMTKWNLDANSLDVPGINLGQS